MLIRSLYIIVFVAASFAFVSAQTADVKKENADKIVKPASGARVERLRDIPFPGGVDLQYLIKELAKDLNINVLFDSQSRLENRKVRIELKNVTASDALKYIMLQEELVAEPAGPSAILVAVRIRATSVPQMGIGTTPMSRQLAQYFGSPGGGILIGEVFDNSPAARAGLRAGDVIVAVDDEPIRGTLGLLKALDSRKDAEFELRFVRDREEQTISMRLSP